MTVTPTVIRKHSEWETVAAEELLRATDLTLGLTFVLVTLVNA